VVNESEKNQGSESLDQGAEPGVSAPEPDGTEHETDVADPGPIASVARRLGLAAWLGVLWVLAPALGGFVLLAQIGPASEWLQSFGPQAPYVYIGLFTVSAGFGFLPTYAQAFVGGWAFGFVPGTLAALGGFVGASIIGRFIARSVARDKVIQEIERHAESRAVRDALLRSGPLKALGIVTLVRFPPNSPFALTNGVLTTTGVPLWIYLVGTAVGMLPRTAIVVWLGAQFEGVLNKNTLSDAKPGWWLPVALAIGLAVFFALLHLGKAAIRKVTASATVDATAESDETDDQAPKDV